MKNIRDLLRSKISFEIPDISPSVASKVLRTYSITDFERIKFMVREIQSEFWFRNYKFETTANGVCFFCG